jgi:transcriptional regulator with XRE-family HTH domain
MIDTARGPAVIRRRLGAALKRYRHSTGLDLATVAKELEISPAKLSRLETGQVPPKLRDVRDLLTLYSAPQRERDKLMRWAEDARGQGWWQPFTADVAADLDLYISLEAEARLVQVYSHLTFSGLLQTRSYSEMMLRGATSHSNSEEQLRRLVDIRQLRREVLSRGPESDVPSLELHAIFHEAAMHAGPPDGPVLIDQLAHILRESKRPAVTIQVFPFSEGFGRASSPLTIFHPRLAEDGIVVNVESTGSDSYHDTVAEVQNYLTIWDSLVGRSLSPERTRERIRETLRARGVEPLD